MSIEIGDVAPDFELQDQHGAPAKLSDYRGKKVVLVFYPLAFSKVCGGEMRVIRDEFVPSVGDDVRVIAVSVDSVFSHRVWAEQEGYTFPQLSDFWPHGHVAQAYGVFDEERGIAARGTFVIDGEGIVRWKVVNPIASARDISDYRKALAAIS